MPIRMPGRGKYYTQAASTAGPDGPSAQRACGQ